MGGVQDVLLGEGGVGAGDEGGDILGDEGADLGGELDGDRQRERLGGEATGTGAGKEGGEVEAGGGGGGGGDPTGEAEGGSGGGAGELDGLAAEGVENGGEGVSGGGVGVNDESAEGALAGGLFKLISPAAVVSEGGAGEESGIGGGGLAGEEDDDFAAGIETGVVVPLELGGADAVADEDEGGREGEGSFLGEGGEDEIAAEGEGLVVEREGGGRESGDAGEGDRLEVRTVGGGGAGAGGGEGAGEVFGGELAAAGADGAAFEQVGGEEADVGAEAGGIDEGGQGGGEEDREEEQSGEAHKESLARLEGMEMPKIRRGEVAHEAHGLRWVDEYGWLRDKESAEVRAALERENAYCESVMGPHEAVVEELYQEILSRIEQTDLSVPVKKGPYFYYSRTEEGKQYPIYCRKEGSLEAAEEAYLDENELAAGHDYFSLGVVAPCRDHRLLAYSTDARGDEDYTVEVKDLASGRMLADRIEKTYLSLVWGGKNEGFYYTVLDEARRPYRVMWHGLGEGSDRVVWEESDERFRVDVYASRSERFVVLEAESSTTTEVRLKEGDGEFRLFRGRQQDIEYGVTHQEEWLYVRINDRGRNFRLVRTPVDAWGEENWEEVLPHRGDVYLELVTAMRDWLVIVEREGGLRRFRYRRRGESEWRAVEFGESAYEVDLVGNLEYEAESLRYQYHSPVTPLSVYDYWFERGQAELKKETAVRGGFERSRYVVERREAVSHDGTRVPMVMVRRRDVDLSEPGPTLLYGYGAYGMSSDAGFSTSLPSLLDRGVRYVIAQVRGGAEMGRPWHDAGRMKQKRNSFLDFVACAETLLREGVTRREQLVIEGGSAGGLLVGGALVMRPDLFGGVLASVPFVDVVHTMLDTTLPLTVGEFEEWGNPAEEEYFHVLREYSPYDNVRRAAYPPMLVTAGLNDPRVPYWEPVKWVARLREADTAGSEILLKVNLGAGHFGASGRYDRLREVAFEFAWLLRTWKLI